MVPTFDRRSTLLSNIMQETCPLKNILEFWRQVSKRRVFHDTSNNHDRVSCHKSPILLLQFEPGLTNDSSDFLINSVQHVNHFYSIHLVACRFSIFLVLESAQICVFIERVHLAHQSREIVIEFDCIFLWFQIVSGLGLLIFYHNFFLFQIQTISKIYHNFF